MTYPEEGSPLDGAFSLKGMIFLSFMAHLVILSLLIFAPSLPTPTVTSGLPIPFSWSACRQCDDEEGPG